MSASTANPQHKRLIIMRHAKAASPPEVSDHQRPLAEAGHEQAPLAGAWLREAGLTPDFILCSTALRTRQTCAWVCQELGEKAPTPKLEDELYDGGVPGLISLLNRTTETVRTLLVVSHMPTVQEASLRLASRDSQQQAYMNLASHYPAAAMAVFDVDKAWAELDGQDAALLDFQARR